MLVHLHLENFMAHGDTHIDLGAGLTVLTGPNNTGKSAVVEGLRCLAENPPAKGFIRHGAKEARVTATFEDGTSVTWLRRKTYAGYEILRPGADEPEEYYKFGRTPPQEVLDVLRMGSVELEGRQADEAVDVHIGNQRSPIFLLDKPPSVVAAFFASSSESSHLLAMQDKLKNMVRRERQNEAELTLHMEGLAADLNQAADLPHIALELEEAGAQYKRIDALRGEIPLLQKKSQTISMLRQKKAAYGRKAMALAELEAPAALWPTSQLSRMLQVRQQLLVRTQATQRRVEALAILQEPPQLFPTLGLSDVLQKKIRVQAASDGLGKRLQALEKLQGPPELFGVGELSNLLLQRKRLERQLASAKAKCTVLDEMTAPPELPERSTLDSLKKTSAQLRSLKLELERQRIMLLQKTNALEDITRHTEILLGEFGECPLCGQPLDAMTFLKGEHHEPS